MRYTNPCTHSLTARRAVPRRKLSFLLRVLFEYPNILANFRRTKVSGEFGYRRGRLGDLIINPEYPTIFNNLNFSSHPQIFHSTHAQTAVILEDSILDFFGFFSSPVSCLSCRIDVDNALLVCRYTGCRSLCFEHSSIELQTNI